MKQLLILLTFCFTHSLIYAQFDGRLDASFGANGRVTTAFGRGHDATNAVLIQPDGKIVAAGHSTKDTLYSGPLSISPRMALARYNVDGTLDNTFGVNGKVAKPLGISAEIVAIALQNDGKIITAVQALDTVSLYLSALFRYHSNGVLDTTFGVNGQAKINFIPSVLTLQTNGKIVVGGHFTTFNGFMNNGIFAVARYETGGVLDTSFNRVGEVFTDIDPDKIDRITGISLQSDNKIVVCGTSKFPTDNDDDVIEPAEMIVIRYNSNGQLDNAFGRNGIVIIEDAKACAVKTLGNGKIIVAGNEYFRRTNNFILLRLNNNGAIDATFNFDAPTSGKATDLAVQRDNKIILAGWTSSLNYPFDFTLLRCDENGILDNTFGRNGKITTSSVYPFEIYRKIALQNDGKLVACGSSKNYGQANFSLMRYNNTPLSVGTQQSNADKNAYFVYPNPTNNTLTIDIKALNTADIEVKIVDMQGRVVLQKNYAKVATNTALQIDIQEFITGLYVLHLTSADKKWTQLIAKY